VTPYRGAGRRRGAFVIERATLRSTASKSTGPAGIGRYEGGRVRVQANGIAAGNRRKVISRVSPQIVPNEVGVRCVTGDTRGPRT